MPAESPPDVEQTPIPAVSSLRSKFEKLAVDSASTTSLHRLSGAYDLLSPDDDHARPRATSVSSDYNRQLSPRQLRPASSSSDLQMPAKRPPPPPPPRSSKGNSPTPSISGSPLLKPTQGPNSPPSPTHVAAPLNAEVKNVKTALLSRKPPPPPPSPSLVQEALPSSGGVSSLINKFGNATSQSPVLPKHSLPSLRVASHSSIPNVPSSNDTFTSSRPHELNEHARSAPRHSFPMSSMPGGSNPTILLQSPFEGGDTDVETSPHIRPPPLPTRRNGPGTLVEHERGESSDSITSSSSSTSIPFASPNEVPSPFISPPSRSSNHAHPPPRPPPRQKAVPPPRQASIHSTQSSTPSPSSGTPPPLPARRASAFPQEESPGRRLPPPRHRSIHESDGSTHHTPVKPPPTLHASPPEPGPGAAYITSPPPVATSTIIQPTERKIFGAHPPPPTRTIALGDKLPPARRPPSGSSSESEEDDLKIKVELLPDSSRASRKPPALDCHPFHEFGIHVPAYTGVVAASGHIVAVSQGHHLKVYDLSESDSPLHDLDARAMGLETKTKDFKVTSLEFRPSKKASDRGCFLWVGTKDGHLFEVDIRAGLVVGMKLAIHSHAVTHMFRHGQSMVTLDETGKLLVFSSDPQSDMDIALSMTPPRVVRISDKQEFAKILGGKLWTSARDSSSSNTVSTSRGPIVRVYDIFTPGTTGKSLLPTDHLGAVSSGTILQTHPNHVYLGHEGGHVSIWTLDTDDGIPSCEEVIKVSTSDVLCLEGVNDRLWAGGRKGTIAAYDVSSRPWTMTNHWVAHQKLPVMRLIVDTWSIEKLGRLSVYSVGRDERIRFWDGLLGVDWIDQELMKREHEFSTFRDLNVLIVSWNLDSAKPDALNGTSENINFLHEALTSVDSPDIIAFGLQELIDLESRKMAAKTVLLGNKNRNPDGALSQKVTTSYKKWYDRLVLAVRLAMPPDTPYTVIHTENLVGLFSCIFVKDTQKISLRNVAITTIKRGMGGRYGNKGGIIARFVIDDTSICFINCHLAAGQSHVRQRNADVAAFLEDKELFPEGGPTEEPVAFVNGGDGTMVLDHEIVFLNGDMNYRIDLRRDAVIADIKTGNFAHLLSQDQLLKEMKSNRGFRLRNFVEGPLAFAPTYKYDRRSDEYDSSEKRRVPAWCDRILWRSREPSRVQQLHYRRYEANVSDHRPISGAFTMTTKSITPEFRARVKQEIQTSWTEHEKTLLGSALAFFEAQALV